MPIHRLSLIGALAAIVLLASLMAAPAAADDDWRYDLAVYGVGAGLDGTVGIGPVDAEVDLGFSDILENLETGGLVFFRATRGRWAVMVDTIFLGLGAANDRVDVDADQLIFEVDGAYRFTETLEVFFGLRYVDIDSRIDLRPRIGPEIRADASEGWVDPVVGLRLEVPLAEKWRFHGRLDAGGFGVGTDLSYQLGINLGYRASQRTSVIFGYRLLDFDYDDGEGLDRFVYDVRISGPQIGVVFHF